MVASRPLLLLCLLLLSLSACSASESLGRIAPVEALVPSPAEQPGTQRLGLATSKDRDSTIKLGYGFRPPRNGISAAQLAQQTGLLVLSKNDEAFRDAIRAEGYDGLILQYILANEIDGPRPDKKCDRSFEAWQNQAVNRPGEFCSVADRNEDWFLHNGAGERLYDRYQGRYYYRMNPASSGWRKFYLARLKALMFGDEEAPPLGYDGFFYDNIELSFNNSRTDLHNSDGRVREFENAKAFRTAWRDWLKYMRDGLGTGVPLWANMIDGSHTSDEWNSYLPFLDGVLTESFITGWHGLSREQQDGDLAQAEYALAQGKGLFAVSQGTQQDERTQQFALASFLLVAEPDKPAYFRYASAENYVFWWLYNNYNAQLGSPLGPRYKVKSGWRRDFENGYVVVDQIKRTGKIVELSSSFQAPAISAQQRTSSANK